MSHINHRAHCQCPVCMSERLEAIAQQRLDHVQRFGCAVQGVFDPDGLGHDFTYSIGFAQFDLPDVIVTGSLPLETLTGILNDLLRRWRNSGMTLGEDHEVLRGLPVRFVPLAVTDTLQDEYVVQAEVFYGRHPKFLQRTAGTPAYVQMLWPDANGRFPDAAEYNHAGCPQRILTAQSDLI